MNNSFLVWFVIAVVLSWAMGAYNRLVRLRAKGLLDFAALEGLLGQYLLLINVNGFEDAKLLDSQGAEGQALLSALNGLGRALKKGRLHPFEGLATADLNRALDEIGLRWRQIRDLPPELLVSIGPATSLAQWEHLCVQVDLARAEFNRAVVNYNEARVQFPAILLAWIFGFKSAQPI